jgi:alpha-amylase/alpha-mannosidase (GH57 family)
MSDKHPLYFTIHGHFYQPPRENPWTGVIENQPSARPNHDWNDRIASQCYSPNSASRILSPHGHIVDIVNNYEYMSFNMGPTLMGWIRTNTPDTYKRIQEADKRSAERLNGHGNAIAQVYNHIIMPLASEQDKRTQIRWGIEDFKFHFGRMPEAMWLAETAINLETVVELIKAGIKFTILSPTQAESFRKFGDEEWKDCSNTSIDTTRPYRVYPRDKDGKLLCDGYLDVFFYNPWLSSAVGFEHLLRDAGTFGRRITDAWDANREEPQLVSIGTDGESYGHHEPFGDMCAAWLYNRYAPEHKMIPVNYGWFLEKFPPKHEVELKNFYGEGCAWSCAHGVGRWYRDCGCSTGGGADWNQKWRGPLRDAFNHLKEVADNIFVREFEKISKIDPWEARNNYIQVIVAPEDESRKEQYLKDTLKDYEKQEDRAKAIRLLEIQKFCLFSFTSCGWFFNDIEGLEPVQNMRYALRAMELLEPFLPFGHHIKNEVISILARATSNEHKWNGAEVFTNYAEEKVPVVVKEMAEQAAIFHLNLEDDNEKNKKIVATKIASRRRQTLVRTEYFDKFINERRISTVLAVTDMLGRINLVVADGENEKNGLKFVENPNMSTQELQSVYPTAYVVRMRNLMSDSLKRINQISTKKYLNDLTQSFSSFALSHGLSIDSLADPDHTLPDTMRKILSLEINSRIHHLALEYMEVDSQEIFDEIRDLVEETNALHTNFSFGGTGRMFYAKLTALIDSVFESFDKDAVHHITGLITVADWLRLGIDKTSLENKVFPAYQEYVKYPTSKISALKPMFRWLNFEV